MHRQTLVHRVGFYCGFLLSYLIFTTILFFILLLTEKIEGVASYPMVTAVTCAIVLVGIGLNRYMR